MNAPDEPVEEERADPAEGDSGKQGDRAGARRAALLGLSAALLILLLGFTAAWVLVPSAKNEPAETANAPLPDTAGAGEEADRLVEQELAPFYIPLPRETEAGMARVSFVLTWDRSSASRFRNQQARVRDRLFRRMTELAAQGENMRGMSLTVQTEARKILEELLQPEELRVVVTGIFIV